MEILKGGVSNKTVLFTREDGKQWVIKQALTRLRVKQDWFCGPDRIKVEFKGMQWLSKVLPEAHVPKPVFFNEANNVLIMDAVAQPHDNLKSLLLDGKINVEWISDLGNLLGAIHATGKNQEARYLFNDKSFFKLLRLEAYYQFTSSRLPSTSQFFNALIDETSAIQSTVVHGDFSPKNVLIKEGKLILLDHEVMHFGDPAFDIGFCLCLLLSMANHLNNFTSGFIHAAHTFWEGYVKRYNDIEQQMEKRAVRHTIGCLLSRVEGRSPLAYLDEKSRIRQVNTGLKLMNTEIRCIPELIDNFETSINKASII